MIKVEAAIILKIGWIQMVLVQSIDRVELDFIMTSTDINITKP